jgi:hypothetical protein
LKSTALPRLRPRCRILSFIKTHSNIIMYSFHQMVFILRSSPYFWKHPTTRDNTWVMLYYIFLKITTCCGESFFLYKIIILCRTAKCKTTVCFMKIWLHVRMLSGMPKRRLNSNCLLRQVYLTDHVTDQPFRAINGML